MKRFTEACLAFVVVVFVAGCSSDPDTPRSTSGAGSGGAGGASAGASSSATGATSAGSGSTAGSTSASSGTSGGAAGADGVAVTAGSGGNGGGTGGGAGLGGGTNDAAAGSGGGAGSTSDAGADASGPVCSPGTGTVDAGTKSVLDRKTCLVWDKAPSASMTNKQAAKYCDQLDQDGFADWRVPAPEELATSPAFVANGNAYVTNPIYIPTSAASDQEGCTGDSHSCNLSQYNAGSIACAWQGVGFAGPVLCVRGKALAGTTATAFAATSCAACSSHVTGATADFKLANCLPFAM